MALRTVDPATLSLTDHIRSGDLVSWGQALAEPLALIAKYTSARHEIGPTRALVGLSLARTIQAEHTDMIRPISYGALGSLGPLHDAGLLDMVPCRYSLLPGMIADGRLRPDVMLVQLSPPGRDGSHSLGWCNDVIPIAMQHARVVLAEINPNVPWVKMDTTVDESLITAAIDSDLPPAVTESAVPGEVETAIAGHLAEWIDDGATLQYGIGAIPSAILRALAGHRDLGLHSGLVTDEVVDLVESGAMTHARKPLLPGIGAAAVAIGGERLSRFMTDNDAFRMCQASFTHGAASLAALDNLVAINSALEVDLVGQVNAEQFGGRYRGAIGGQPDFMHAATYAPRGLSVIAMPATSGKSRTSRIVGRLSGRFVTTAHSDVDLVVTEQGAADLRGLTLPRKAGALIGIADPAHREDLARAAVEQGLAA